MTELSVVMISRNQEWNIARLIESVLRETARFDENRRELVLVDSASTDKTTEIAVRYPISVLKMCAEQRLTAAAGRNVGYRYTKGDLVLFLDGDMEICEGWLESALEVMRSRSDVAAVSGGVIERPLAPAIHPGKESEAIRTGSAAVDVLQGGGAAMYRRSVLEQVGTFNPYLYSDEEPALCLRIRHAGYRILKLPRPIAFHYSSSEEAFSTLWARRSRNLWLGFGQNIRYFSTSPLLFQYLRERGWALTPAIMIGTGFLTIVTLGLTGQFAWVASWTTCVVMLTIGLAIRKHSLKRALFSLMRRLLILEGTIRGLLLKPYDPVTYPGKYHVVR